MSRMRRFVEVLDRGQATPFPECLEDWIDADNPLRMIDAFVEKLKLTQTSIAIDARQFKSASIRDKNFTREKVPGVSCVQIG